MFSKVRFEVISGLYCEFLSFLVTEGFCISSIESTPFGFTAVCSAEEYIKLAKTARNFQCRTKILQKKGLYFKTAKIHRRKGILAGIVVVFLCIHLFSNIIWRIDVITPQNSITTDVYDLLYYSGIYPGAIFNEDKNHKVRQQIFIQVEDVGYVTLNFSKGILTCKVDRSIDKIPYLENSKNGNITATESGVIEDLRVYNGFSLVQTGQSVEKGDVLVSSTYLDRNGTLQQVMPRAYIKAYCRRTYTAQLDYEKDVYLRTGKNTTQTKLKLSGRQLAIKKPQLEQDTKYDKETTFSQLTLWGFMLPATMETTTFYEKQLTHITRDEKTVLDGAIKTIEAVIAGDNSLIEAVSKEYTYQFGEQGVDITCNVYGYYDITK